MAGPAENLELVRFGDFEFDRRTGDLRREGTVLRLQPQPAKVLGILVSRAGQVVTRQELAGQVWGSDTFVDFEQGLNYAIRQIRTVLQDDADHPSFLQTLPKRGYRFIAPVIGLGEPEGAEQDILQGERQASNGPSLATEASSIAAGRGGPPAWGRWKLLHWSLVAAAGVLLVTVLVSRGSSRVFRGLFSSAPNRSAQLRKPIRSLAVLPLVNLTGDASQENLVDGMTDALIANLAQIKALKVISRTSAMSYKGTRKPLPQIARELGVDAVVEGSVMRQGDRIRVTGQLILAATDEHLWAESFDRELHDVLVLQNDVARAISEEVKINLTPAEAVRLSTARGVNPAAYQAYLWGRFHVSRRSPEGVDSALTYFEDAIRKDPTFAPGYAGLAQSYAVLPEQRDVPFRPNYAKAKEAALRAVQLDENLSEGHAFLALSYLLYDWGFSDAEREFQRAIELNANDSLARRYYAVYLTAQGRVDEARSMIRSAQELDPVSLGVNFHVGRILYFARDYDAAIEQSRRTLELDPDNVQALVYQGMAYSQKGMHSEAIAALMRAEARSKGLTAALGPLGYAYARAGRRQSALRIAHELEQFSKRGGIAAYYLAELYAALGDTNASLAWLQQAEQARDPMMVTRICLDPALDGLRANPRFIALLTRDGFAGGQDKLAAPNS